MNASESFRIEEDVPRTPKPRRLLNELSGRLISQSPVGLAAMDTDLRYVGVNPALERINGLSTEEHVGRHVSEILPHVDTGAIEAAQWRVLETGVPLLDQNVIGRTWADPDHDHAWSVSLYRLQDPVGRIRGVAASIADVTARHCLATEAARSRQRLALIADASALIGTVLNVDQTARELAEVTVPALADIAAVDILDTVLACHRTAGPGSGPELFRALALAAAYPSDATRAADRVGDLATYAADRLVTQCVHTGKPVLIPDVHDRDLPRIARDPEAATLLACSGVHSYLAVPLIARGIVLGALDLKRTRNPLPFNQDDAVLAGELAGRAAVSIDNARWYQSVCNTAVTLQRSLLPEHPPHLVGLEIASRYQPAQATSAVGGDWFDIIPLTGDKTVLVVGDVMGSGIDAAAAMGRLRTATCTLAELDFDPAQVLQHLDRITSGLEHYIATCLYAVYDPHHGECHIANAGHMPPVLVRPGRPPELLDLYPGAPLGVGGITFQSRTIDLEPRDDLVLYTDGLVETRHHPIDDRLQVLLSLLEGSESRPVGETCDLLLHSLRDPGDHDDVALLIARTLPDRS